MASISEPTPGEANEFGNQSPEEKRNPQPIMEGMEGSAKGFGWEKNAQLNSPTSGLLPKQEDVLCHVIQNPEKPLTEYVMVFPEEYREELTFEDYRKFKKVFQSASTVGLL